MAIDATTQQAAGSPARRRKPAEASIGATIHKLLAPLASLKLTVALFAMAIFLILAGTLAQTEKDIWEVVHNYFRTSLAWIELKIFFPKSFFPSDPQVPGGFYFPGGWLIGLLLAVNLLAAHSVRFKIQASGTRLKVGLGAIAAGIVLTGMVVTGGSTENGLKTDPLIEWSTLWMLFKIGLVLLWLAAAYALATLERSRHMERAMLVAAVAGLGSLLAWLFWQYDDVALGDSSMRILWQLIQGGLAGLVLLVGSIMVFKKRGGVVLLHTGIGLMMFSELLVGTIAVEGQMLIKEGETVNFVQDIRSIELAMVDPSDPDEDDVVVVPQSVLLGGEKISHDDLPVDVELVKFLQNSTLRRAGPHEPNPATDGAGREWLAVEKKPGAGTDTGGKVDMSAAYVRLIKKGTSEPLTTRLVSLYQDRPEKVAVDGKTYDVNLRFKRDYKPYSMHLVDVRFDKYLGTNTPKNYSSDLRLVDPTRSVDREVKIWMNNPLRFAGETFYQSSFNVDEAGAEITGLQVVSNTGWMIPYVACMIVATGLLAHFAIALVRFLRRRSEMVPTPQTNKRASATSASAPSFAVRWLPVAVVVIFGLWLAGKARPEKSPIGEMNIAEFGRLPLVYEGRVKPFDTLARNSLRIISDRETFRDESGRTQPAMRWLLDVISDNDDALKHQVFRIENLEVLDTLGLSRRKGYRYSVDEFREQMGEFEKQVRLAQSLATDHPEKLSVYQRKMIELDRKIRTYTLLLSSFRPPPLPPLPTAEEFEKDRAAATKRLEQFRRVLLEMPEQLARMQPPLAVPVDPSKGKWEPYSTAWTQAFVRARLLGQEPEPATVALNTMLVAYAKDDAKEFNRELETYRALLAKNPPTNLDVNKTRFEAFFNHFSPFYHASVLYVVAFVLASLAWLGWSRPLNRAAFWLIAFTLAIHTFALIARIYISGRPPVTNLYSSAVFIGWGCVILGMVLEAIYRIGIGNVVASVAGFATLLIAHFLAGDGDTFVVLQAVLDTQFWLATHVTCITLGYATTYLAGILGVLYILRGVLTPSLSPGVGKDLSRMIYGTLCFAIFFSFVGTVLGGLWADDSWGRFWGWDPKENGALIIVLWNALVLHARWGGMIAQRGLAVLAVAGNIAVSWSWFGVNELGVGLHSYGFTEGVLRTLGFFILSQLAVIALGLLPLGMWWSCRNGRSSASSI